MRLSLLLRVSYSMVAALFDDGYPNRVYTFDSILLLGR